MPRNAAGHFLYPKKEDQLKEIQDLEKAVWYIEREIQRLKEQS